jgi:hypothetical protein
VEESRLPRALGFNNVRGKACASEITKIPVFQFKLWENSILKVDLGALKNLK